MKNVKMQRFLASIGIENSERYDMDFVAVQRIIGSNSIHMIIRKDTPWDNDLLEEFKEHLAFIDYEYKNLFNFLSILSLPPNIIIYFPKNTVNIQNIISNTK